MKKIILVFAVIAIMVLTQSCATILGGSRASVSVKGTPENAKVYVNGSYKGEAPLNVKVPRGKRATTTIKVEANNYKPAEIEITSRVSLGYLGLDIITGLIPAVIDFATGNIYAPYPKSVKYKLEPQGDLTSKFKVGQTVTVEEKNKLYKGTVTEVLPDGLKVKYERPATTVEKAAKKTDKVTVEKVYPFNKIKNQ